MRLLVKKLNPEAKIPTKAHTSDAGYDLYSDEDIVLIPKHPVKIKSGVALAVEADDHFGMICDRSSMGSKGIRVLGGIADSSYRGEIIICLINLGLDHYKIQKGDKIAQIIFMPKLSPEICEVSELNETERGSNGFGSSGK